MLKRLLSFILNRSLFWKVGAVIGTCVFVNFWFTFYFYFSLKGSLDILDAASRSVANLMFEKAILILLVISLVLLIFGAAAFYLMVKKPLDRIRRMLLDLLANPQVLKVEFENPSPLRMQDEIGSLALTFDELIKRFQDLEIFRHLIESDEELEEVYERLGKALENLGFGAVVIYEVSNSANAMSVIYKTCEDLEVSPEPLFVADKCRAKRTGEMIDSITTPYPCKYYEYQGITNHVCIPMIYGGKVLAVVEIHLPMTVRTLKGKDSLKKLAMVRRYIEQTAPIVESKRYALALKEQSLKDPLTNLFNRRYIDGILENLTAQILRRGTTLGILMCDLDYFKSINDKYGHDVGDLVLKELASVLTSVVRKSDLVVRFGGEEFLILLVDIKEGESEKIAEKIRKKVEEHEFRTPKGIIRRTISIGCSEFPVDTTHIWEAIKFADVALYKAKELGRNKVLRFQREFWTSTEY